MPEQNVELHRRFVAAFNAGDSERFIALSDPQIEFHSVFAAVGGEVYHGHEGIRTWLSDFEDAWGGDIRLEPEAYFDPASTRSRSRSCTGAAGTAALTSRCQPPQW